MSVILNIMLNFLFIVMILVGIVALLALARFVWITARFAYVTKYQKFKEDQLRAEREYNVTTAENSQLMIANDNIRESYANTLIKQKDAEFEIDKLNKEIEKKEKNILKLTEDEKALAENVPKKRGPGRPPNTQK